MMASEAIDFSKKCALAHEDRFFWWPSCRHHLSFLHGPNQQLSFSNNLSLSLFEKENVVEGPKKRKESASAHILLSPSFTIHLFFSLLCGSRRRKERSEHADSIPSQKRKKKKENRNIDGPMKGTEAIPVFLFFFSFLLKEFFHFRFLIQCWLPFWKKKRRQSWIKKRSKMKGTSCELDRLMANQSSSSVSDRQLVQISWAIAIIL